MRRRGDDGSAVVDFVLVSVLLLTLFLLVLQVGVVLHVRNVVTSAAAEGARFGAAADRMPAQGARHAELVVREALGSRVRVRCTPAVVQVRGAPVVEVHCRGPVPVVLLPTPLVQVAVSGHALEEAR